MEVTYTLTANDFLWLTARGWLDARPFLKRRILIGLLGFALSPFFLAWLFPSLSHAITAFWVLDIVVFAALIVVVVALVKRFSGPLFPLDAILGQKTIAIGPDCVVEQGDDVVAVPWQYVQRVHHDLLSVEIIIDSGERYTIPRRAFANYIASWKFSILAALWWRKGHRAVSVETITPKQIR